MIYSGRTIYDYQPGRSGLFAKNYLQDFKGQYLQTDGYSGYAQVCTPEQLSLQHFF